MTSIAVLGPLEVLSTSGEDITPTGERERAAVALLALTAPEVVSTERLADELYGPGGVSDPRNAVQAVISRLRKAFGRDAGAIETHGRGYRMVDIAIDVDQADELFRIAQGPNTTEAREAVDACLDLWRGASLADVSGSGVLAAEQHRLDELRRSAADRRFALRLEEGTDGSLIADLEAATRSEPTREQRWVLLMTAQYRQGRQADALTTFQRARHLMAEQLGLDPGPHLVELERRILEQDPNLLADPERTVGTTGPQPSDNGATALPSGTLTVLLCGVADAAAWEPAPAMTADALTDLGDIWARHVEAADGVVVKSTNDVVMAVFETADAAARATVGAQREGRRLGLGVGSVLHSGPLTPVGSDYRGPVVDRCARLLELCSVDQILLTQTAAELMRDELGESTIRSLGFHQVRDIPDAMEVFQLDAPGLPWAFPDLRSSGPRDLPRRRSDIVGRDQLLADLIAAIETDSLVTLLGPGGIGKTTLAVAAAWANVHHRRVIFVDLASTREADSVGLRVADAVSPGEADRPTAIRVGDRLRTAADLVILDNAEHVLDAVAELADDILTQDMRGTILVTSRSPLAVPGEQMIAVPPLEVPEDHDLETTSQTPAVSLFLARLRQVRSDAIVGNGMLPVVAHICRRLDGIPLAIELAASRGALLGIDDIAARLDDQLRLLRQIPATRDRRHRSLEAVVTWSLDLLTSETRKLFSVLSVFAGSFTVDAVEAVVGRLDLDPAAVLDAMMELQSASLITADGPSRVRMLEPVRQVAAAELAEQGRTRETRHEHARWATGLLRDAFDLDGPDRMRAFAAADAEAAEVRAATERIAEEGFDDLVADFAVPGGYWFLTRDPQRGHVWERIAERCTGNELTSALAALGWNIAVADLPTDVRLGDTVAVLDRHQHPDRAMARIIAALQLAQDGNPHEATTSLDEAQQMNDRDDPWIEGYVHLARAMVHPARNGSQAADRATLSEAVARASSAAEVFRELDDRWSLGLTLGELGRMRQQIGDLDGAEAALLESLELVGDAEYHGAHTILSELGVLAGRQGRFEAAESYHSRALEVATIRGGSHCVAASYVARSASAREQGDAAAVAAALETAIGLVDAAEAGRMGWSKLLEEARSRLETAR